MHERAVRSDELFLQTVDLFKRADLFLLDEGSGAQRQTAAGNQTVKASDVGRPGWQIEDEFQIVLSIDLHLHAPAIDPLTEQHQPHVMHIFFLERLQTEDIVHDAEIQPFFSGKAVNERKI